MFLNKGFLYMAIIFAVSVALAVLDPLNLDPLKESSTSAIKVLYLIPGLIAWVWIFFLSKVDYSAKSAEEKKLINQERIASILRSVLQVVGTIIAIMAVLNIDIPIIGSVFDALKYLTDNLGIAVNAVEALIGIGLTVYGFFIKQERFEVRAGVGKRVV